MKKILFFIVAVLISSSSFSQNTLTQAQRDSLLEEVSSTISSINNKTSLPTGFKLYKTENIYTFLKLNTSTGAIYQLQWSLDDDNEGTIIINSEDLSINRHEGAFELYPTSNMYQFILLDTLFGRTWHVQWGFEANKRWIKRIY